jgi:serine protease Do
MKKGFISCFLLLAFLFGFGFRATCSEAAAKRALNNNDFRNVILSAKEKVFPAVVFIKCLRENLQQGKKIIHGVSGSGVIISSKGELLTNWHVVDKSTEVRCLLSDGSAYHGKVLGSDKDVDLALVQLVDEDGKEVKLDLPTAELGDSSKVIEGDFVMAMGAPWGLSRSVSMGIISCTRRVLRQHSQYSLWFQTDAAISPGNSGGPLINTDGKIIGINTRGVLYGGDMGFAVPSNTIKEIVPQLRQFGKVNWTYTGLQLQPLRDFDRNIYFDEKTGVIVAGTDPDSPASKAGLMARDRIISVNGTSIVGLTEEDLPYIRRFVGKLSKEKEASLKVYRNGKLLDIKITPRIKGKVEGEELELPRWDFTVKAINQFDNPELYFYKKSGVFIYGIKYPGNAQKARLGRGDIVLSIDGKEINTMEDIKALHKELIANIDKKHRVLVVLLKNGLQRQAVLDFAQDFERE